MIGGTVTLDIDPLSNLRKSGFRKSLRIALNRSSAIVKSAMVSSASAIKGDGNGYLSKSIRIKIVIRDGSGQFAAFIGPSRSFKRAKGKFKRGVKRGQRKEFRPARYAHVLEFGSKSNRKRPFVAPAWNATNHQFATSVNSEVAKELASHAIKSANKK